MSECVCKCVSVCVCVCVSVCVSDVGGASLMCSDSAALNVYTACTACLLKWTSSLQMVSISILLASVTYLGIGL